MYIGGAAADRLGQRICHEQHGQRKYITMMRNLRSNHWFSFPRIITNFGNSQGPITRNGLAWNSAWKRHVIYANIGPLEQGVQPAARHSLSFPPGEEWARVDPSFQRLSRFCHRAHQASLIRVTESFVAFIKIIRLPPHTNPKHCFKSFVQSDMAYINLRKYLWATRCTLVTYYSKFFFLDFAPAFFVSNNTITKAAMEIMVGQILFDAKKKGTKIERKAPRGIQASRLQYFVKKKYLTTLWTRACSTARSRISVHKATIIKGILT